MRIISRIFLMWCIYTFLIIIKYFKIIKSIDEQMFFLYNTLIKEVIHDSRQNALSKQNIS